MGQSGAGRRGIGRRAGWLFLAFALLLGGCSSARHDARAEGTTLDVTLRDFRIVMSRERVSSGNVDLSIANLGPVNHEFILVRSQTGVLPMRADGVTVDEDALAKSTIATLEPGPPGETRKLRVDLTPGHYEIICNMAGHFLGGMHAELTVS